MRGIGGDEAAASFFPGLDLVGFTRIGSEIGRIQVGYRSDTGRIAVG
jgi:hypothetical protein